MKRLLALTLVFTLSASSVFGAETNFSVNPTTIEKQLFSSNMTLLQALNNVQASKLNVSQSRAKLLPTINLGMLLPALANPTFLLAQVTFLFPFLVPSNWMALKQSNELFEADKESYKVIQLNVLSSALSLYYTYVNDQKVQNTFNDQVKILGKIYSNLKRQSEILGNISAEELAMAEAQWQEGKIKVSKLEELLIEEKVSLRTMLGLPIGTTLEVVEAELPKSNYEESPVGIIIDRSMEVAPEANQMRHLVSAAKAGKFSKMFGFVNSASMGGSASDSGGAFDNLKGGGSFNIGYENVVNVKIANNNIASILLREAQLKQENEKTAEIISGKLIEAKEQKALSESALSNRMKVYQAQMRQYELGFIPLQTLLLTQSQLTEIKVNTIKTDLDLSMQRLTLNRLVIDGFFEKVKGCQPKETEEKRSFFKRKKEKSLDELCRP
jgi:multidrug efflux system outer membrane protein